MVIAPATSGLLLAGVFLVREALTNQRPSVHCARPGLAARAAGPVEEGGRWAGRPVLAPPPSPGRFRVFRHRWETEIQTGEPRVRQPPRMEFVKYLGHPEEFYNLLRFRMGGQRKFIPKMDQVGRASLYPHGSVAAARTGDNGERPRALRSLWKGGFLTWVPHPSWTLSSS